MEVDTDTNKLLQKAVAVYRKSPLAGGNEFDTDTNKLLQKAVAVYRKSPLAGGNEFDIEHAMKMVGIDEELAKTRVFKEKMKRLLKGTPRDDFEDTNEAKLERSIFIFRNAMFDTDGKQSLTKMKAMRLAGCTPAETSGNTALYAKFGRALTKLAKEDANRQAASAKEKAQEEMAASILSSQNCGALDSQDEDNGSNGGGSERDIYILSNPGSNKGQIVCHVIELKGSTFSELDSPLSFGGLSGVSQSQSHLSSDAYKSVSRPAIASSKLSTSSSLTSSSRSISKSTASASHRRSAKEAQAARKDAMELENIRKSAYKVGTVLYDGVKSGQNTLIKFGSAENCAREVNGMFGYDLVSGYQLKDGVKNNQIGLSPPRRGTPSRIPDDEFKALASLVFSCESIEQANVVENRLTRPKVISIIGEIVNGYFISIGELPMDEVSFYKRIEKFNWCVLYMLSTCK